MSIALVLFFAMAVSLDGVAVGVAYGLRGVRVPLASLVVIGLASGLSVAASMAVGQALSVILSPLAARVIGGLLLAGLGIFLLREARKDSAGDEPVPAAGPVPTLPESPLPVLQFRIPPLRMVVRVLREPEVADVDRSGFIGVGESFIVGLALALDAFGAGLAAGLTGMPAALTGTVAAVVASGFLEVGIRLGGALERGLGSRLRLVPGFALVVLGLMRVIR